MGSLHGMRRWAGLAAAAVVVACGGDDATVTCGAGTTQQGSVCVPTGTSGPGDLPSFEGVADVSPAGDTALQIAWPAATDSRTPSSDISYEVFLATESGKFGAVTRVVAPGVLSTVIPGLEAGTTYYARVRAKDAEGNSDENVKELSGAPSADSTAPTFAGATTAEAGGAARVKLSWAAGSDDKTGAAGLSYAVWAADTAPVNTNGAPLAVSEPGATSVVVKVPGAQEQYQFVVRARDAAGNLSADTPPVAGTSGADTVPPIFRGCSGAEASGASGIRVFWKAPSDDSTDPELIKIRAYVRKASDADFNFAQPAGEFTGGTDGTVTGLDAATQYFVVCRAADAFGNEDQNEVTRSATTVNDDQPPVFGGITGTSDVTTTGVTLGWDAATDNRSAAADIIYEIYQSQNPGEVDFTQPPAFTTPAGATSFAVTGLTPGTTYYFTVRATDEAGNQSTNTEERPVPLRVSFAVNVQAVFTASCALADCHVGAQPAGGMRLQEGAAYADIVNKPSAGKPAFDRIEPGSRTSSYLYQKITNAPGIVGRVMPLTGSLPPETLDLIGRWIDEGAENN